MTDRFALFVRSSRIERHKLGDKAPNRLVQFAISVESSVNREGDTLPLGDRIRAALDDA